ncbi:GNAT family N-acetyltransferase [Glycomyces xiaoerkulensis]|uniref:GNAT family N-acetyltransferase n=1 Tax=Glycomyces xiaoerkulensis TaxID=2038139 RepID=UPI000C266778|nr:GNAT family N-acetyltransferase [Glycomyces xiaoerkulensis]
MTVLRTERLVLRPVTTADVEPLVEINADTEVMRYIGNGSPRTLAETRTAVEKMTRHWDEQGWGPFVVGLAGTGEPIGLAILAVPGFLPEILPAVEVGWRIGRNRWGRGYAPEAAAAVIRFAFEELGMERLVSCVHRDNTASVRVTEKLGMSLERETTVPDLEVPVKVYELRA